MRLKFTVAKDVVIKGKSYRKGDTMTLFINKNILPLLEKGCISPPDAAFDILWKDHVKKIKKFPWTLDQVYRTDKELYSRIIELAEITDTAWSNSDFLSFFSALSELNELCQRANQVIQMAEVTEPDKPGPGNQDGNAGDDEPVELGARQRRAY